MVTVHLVMVTMHPFMVAMNSVQIVDHSIPTIPLFKISVHWYLEESIGLHSRVSWTGHVHVLLCKY